AAMLDAGNGRLFHAWRAGQAKHAAMLEDYGAMAGAAIALFEATGIGGYLVRATAWLETLERDFPDGAGGYFTASADAPDVPARQRGAADNATPSGNGLSADALARLWWITFEDRWRLRAEGVLNAFGAEARRNPAAHPWLLCTSDLLANGLSVAISAGAGAEALAAAATRLGDPALVITRASAAPLPAGHPASGKGPIAGRAAAYVCSAGTCQAPATTAEALAQAVGAARR
ncbi:MAG: thioredoxin domain-containing protein, partial [Acetobacteraceae bacterium]|nr:thioredoxin domain-containing protein [Acetobacteraceae bacterium]